MGSRASLSEYEYAQAYCQYAEQARFWTRYTQQVLKQDLRCR